MKRATLTKRKNAALAKFERASKAYNQTMLKADKLRIAMKNAESVYSELDHRLAMMP